MTAKINYNERSWAIDVISEINLHLNSKGWALKSAGGENTIISNKSSLFPDVLIFRDISKNVILHGWELKMPDTPINDKELIDNAIKKAQILKRDSFLLWNVQSAVLYVKDDQSYSVFKSWDSIDITSRSTVKANEQLWKDLLYNILEDLNQFFTEGDIIGNISAEILSIDTVIDVVLQNIELTSEELISCVKKSSLLDANVDKWWLSSASEYGFNPTSDRDKTNKYPTLARVILTDWVFKIIFANILKRYFNEARYVETINFDTTVNEAKNIVLEISEHCNFWNIFSDNLAIDQIPTQAWVQIVQLNQFFTTIDIDSVDITILHDLLQSSVETAKRKVAGQFATPKKLADLLTRLTINDKEGITLDPCCGTGTIIQQAYLLKEEYKIPQDNIINNTWASDKHAFPIQLATLNLARPDNIGKVLNIFKSDVVDLNVGLNIELKDPNNGSKVEKSFPPIDYIVSNLPFIKNKEIEVLNPNIKNINKSIQEQINTNQSLSGKSDIFVYIPFYLHNILSKHGRIGLILSNAWLGTDYGERFLELFQKYFNIDSVVISGKGKWFKNADVVATLLIASKKEPSIEVENSEREISFCTIIKDIDEIEDIKQLSFDIILSTTSANVNIQKYTTSKIRGLESLGMPWSAYFTNLNWLPSISDKLVHCNHFFNFTRGERRGWNAMFYPESGHGVESEYIQPVLKNLRTTRSLTSITNAEAFCCSRTIEELVELGHVGAVSWIQSFENQLNNTGVPLTESLRRANMHWYEMTTDNMADFVANINYDRSLFIAQFETRSFIDQRMIGLSVKEDYESESRLLFLALLNSVLSMFFIESFGFGRGLGALDLRATKFESDFSLLNIEILSEEQKHDIVRAFEPILNRDRLPLERELAKEDRIHFENTLFEAFGISEYYDSIKSSLLDLYKIRFAVKD